MKTQFSVIFLDEALEFFERLNSKEQTKVLFNI